MTTTDTDYVARLKALRPDVCNAMDQAGDLMMDTDDTKFEVGLGYIWDALRSVLNLIEDAEKEPRNKP